MSKELDAIRQAKALYLRELKRLTDLEIALLAEENKGRHDRRTCNDPTCSARCWR